jgi:GNAT superfamily N-acetyltransferase
MAEQKNLEFKEVPKTDKEQVLGLIGIVISELENKEYFIPYEQWELDSLFDKNYAPIHGAYDGKKLVGIAQLYVKQEMLSELKEVTELTEYVVCVLGGNLILPEYRGFGITTKLQTMQLELAKRQGFDYIISIAHPNNIGSLRTLEKIGLKYLRTTSVANGYLRNVYIKKL